MDTQEYEKLFNDFISLVDKQLEYFEKDDVNMDSLARNLPALISLVNTIGYLRGQDGMFLDFRPHTDKQSHFYKQEDVYEKRLVSLIERVLGSNAKDYYLKRLHSYYCKVRTLEGGDLF